MEIPITIDDFSGNINVDKTFIRSFRAMQTSLDNSAEVLAESSSNRIKMSDRALKAEKKVFELQQELNLIKSDSDEIDKTKIAYARSRRVKDILTEALRGHDGFDNMKINDLKRDLLPRLVKAISLSVEMLDDIKMSSKTSEAHVMNNNNENIENGVPVLMKQLATANNDIEYLQSQLNRMRKKVVDNESHIEELKNVIKKKDKIFEETCIDRSRRGLAYSTVVFPLVHDDNSGINSNTSAKYSNHKASSSNIHNRKKNNYTNAKVKKEFNKLFQKTFNDDKTEQEFRDKPTVRANTLHKSPYGDNVKKFHGADIASKRNKIKKMSMKEAQETPSDDNDKKTNTEKAGKANELVDGKGIIPDTFWPLR